MKLIIIILISAFIIVSNSCRDISFNNPLDPDASKETAKTIKIIETLLSGSGDIDYHNGNIWKTSPSGTYYLMDIESGTIIRSIQGDPAVGIAVSDGEIYTCSGENSIQVYDSLSGELLKQIITTDMYPQYCCFSYDLLIIFDNRSKSFFSLDLQTNESKRLFEASGISASGISVYNNGLLIVDNQTNSIYSFSIDGVIRDVFRSPATDIAGITVDENNLIYIYNLNGQIYKVSLP